MKKIETETELGFSDCYAIDHKNKQVAIVSGNQFAGSPKSVSAPGGVVIDLNPRESFLDEQFDELGFDFVAAADLGVEYNY